LFFGIILLKHGRHFGCWHQPLNMSMRVWYLECHETGLCCYLVIHIENLLRPLQLFYFHVWPIYWLSLACQAHQITLRAKCIVFKGKGSGTRYFIQLRKGKVDKKEKIYKSIRLFRR
jgi:hypothetical protein